MTTSTVSANNQNVNNDGKPADKRPTDATALLRKTLSNLSQTLMGAVPNDIRDKTNTFLKEVARAVDSVIADLTDTADKAIAQAEAAQKMIGSGKKANANEETFILKRLGSVTGTYQTLYRESDPSTPLFCIHSKRQPNQPVTCGAHCAGFKVLSDGNVVLCNKTIRQIERG